VINSLSTNGLYMLIIKNSLR